MSKGVSEIATMAIYVGVTVTAISGAITVGAPALENMQDANSIRKAQNFMQTVDSNVQEVVSEGEGSTRTMDVSFDRGDLYFNNDTESLIYELRTDASVISPQTSKRDGNIILSSSANVKVNKTTIDGTPCYLMKNDHIKACIKNVGSSGSPQNINTSKLVVLYEFKSSEGSNKNLDGNITVKLNAEPSSSYGTGYTEAEQLGEYIGTGRIKATVSSDYGFKYDVLYQLPTGADFLKIDVQNFR
ncbi:MAG: hypothetical protein H8Z69_00455 [Nanohaloarchaea archaeon]|nr:hypothetical protein [Candidatus Nanohaloarchaea archaeon]